jgi:hypothetical protein
LLFIVSGASLLVKKIKEQGFLRKSHQKHTPWIRDPEKIHPGSGSRIPNPGGKKAPDPGSGIRIRNTGLEHEVNCDVFVLSGIRRRIPVCQTG